jgi:hypothetical protein
MPNPIKYSTGSETDALKKGNLYIGTGAVGKGPSDVTGYYQGVDAPSSGYTIYLYNENSSSDLSYHVANNDEELISFTNGISNQSFTSSTECLNYYITQTDKVCFNKNYEPIITDGLIYNLDAGFISSYTQSGTTWYGVGQSAYTATLTNSPTFSTSDGGIFVFDGIDDFIAGNGIEALGYTNNYTISLWLKSTGGGYIFANKTNSGERIGICNPSFTPNVMSAFFYNGSFYTTVGQTYESNKWINVVVTNQNQQLTLYVSLNKSTTQISGSGPLDPGGNGLRIGRRNRTAEFYFTGNISQLQIYNRVLSEDEITKNYNAQKGRFGL